jgi:type II secretory pathway pseudopilin PulG
MVQKMRVRTGFTLVELLVIVAIIAVLIALLLPAVQRAREAANVAQCTSQLKAIGQAMEHYVSKHRYFPDAGDDWTKPRSKFPTGIPRLAPDQDWGWGYQILPFIEFDSTWSNPNDNEVAATIIPIYFCLWLAPRVYRLCWQWWHRPGSVSRGKHLGQPKWYDHSSHGWCTHLSNGYY